MRRFLPSLALVLFFASHSFAQTWYTLTYLAPQGSQFTGFSGNMHIPSLPRAGTYYLWPGLQPTDGSGVYQEVLDGRSGSWEIAPGWCCSNPSLPWGSGFGTAEGDVVAFSNLQGATQWASVITNSTGATTTNDFPLDGKTFSEAIFAIELYGQVWDFGPLEFTNIVITATGTDNSWCTDSPINSNTQYTISGLSSVVEDGVITCSIANLTMESPA